MAKKRKTVGARSETESLPVPDEVGKDEVKPELKPETVSDETPIRDEWKELELVDIKDTDSHRTGDVVIRRDQQKHGFDNRIYKKLRTPGEGTGYCVMVYDKK